MKVLETAVAVLLLVGVAQASGDDDHHDDFDCHTADCYDLGAGTYPCPDCSGYITCSAGGPPFIKSYFACPSNTKYDSQTGTCATGLVGCTHSDTGHLDHEHSCDCNKVGPGVFPCPDCDGYHICTKAADGAYIDDYTECSSGTSFDFTTSTCTATSTATHAQCDAAHDG